MTHVDSEMKTMFGTRACIGQGIVYRSWDVMLHLYKSLVRQYLEYCAQYYSLIYWKDVSKLERSRKHSQGCYLQGERLGVKSERKIEKAGTFSLQHRRLMGDLKGF